jgi:hypothetical protein
MLFRASSQDGGNWADSRLAAFTFEALKSGPQKHRFSIGRNPPASIAGPPFIAQSVGRDA